jgi:2'-5' RNA ligase
VPASDGPSGNADRLRLFVALTPPKAVIEALAAAQGSLRAVLAEAQPDLRLRWVGPHGFHLTLRFLGDTPCDRLAAIAEAMLAVAETTAPLSLRLDQLGTFGGRRPRVVVASLAGETEADVASLQGCTTALNIALAAQGFPIEERPLRPHLTLARLPQRADREARSAVLQAVDRASALPAIPFPARSMQLIASELQPGGALYTTRLTAPFPQSRARIPPKHPPGVEDRHNTATPCARRE